MTSQIIKNPTEDVFSVAIVHQFSQDRAKETGFSIVTSQVVAFGSLEDFDAGVFIDQTQNTDEVIDVLKMNRFIG